MGVLALPDVVWRVSFSLTANTSGCQKSSLDARIFLRLWKDRVHWESQPRNENTPRTAFLRIPEMNTKSHALPYKNKSCWVCAKGKAHFYSFLPHNTWLESIFFFFINVAVADEFPLMFVLKGPNPILLCGAFGHLVYQSMKLYLIRFEILHDINISLITELSKGHTLLLFSIVFSKQQKHLRNVLRAQKQDKITDN